MHPHSQLQLSKGIQATILRPGSGPIAKAGRRVTVGAER